MFTRKSNFMRACSTEDSPGGRFSFRESLALFLSVGTILLVVIAGCGHQEEPVEDYISVGKGYLGNTACMDCHQKEFEQHRNSNHATTMREVNAESMGKFMPKPGPLEGTDMEIFPATFGLAMGWKGNPEGMLPMQYALGSGRFGFTFIQLENDSNLLELRQSFYTQTHSWALTPGQEGMGNDFAGRRHEGLNARHCLSCHVTALPAKGLTPEPRFFGVGCESCHGPGKKHVDAVKAGDKNIAMKKLGGVGAKQLNGLCGHCHRTEQDLAPEDMKMTQRFAPYGLMKSRCFLESGDTLSCLTCHDVHENASSDTKMYERTCLKCHAPTPAFGPSEIPHKTCKVNPRTGCIPCHMPKNRSTPSTPFTMTDHYIRVFSKEEGSNATDLPFELSR